MSTGLFRRRGEVVGVIVLGGVVGAEARYGLSVLVPDFGGFPWATLLVNVSGCLLIGALVALLAELTASHRLARPFLAVGVLGGYTTFSAYAVDAQRLLVGGDAMAALGYLMVTPMLALAAVWTGAAVVRRVIERRRGVRQWC